MTLMFNDDAVVPKGDRPGDGLIEHMRQQDVIKTADHVIDLGPGGGVNGGKVVVTGTPEEVAACGASYTGQYLRPLLERATRAQLSTPADSKKGAAQRGPQPVKKKTRRRASSDEDIPDLIAAK